MKTLSTTALAIVLAVTASILGALPASAAHTNLERRNSGLYEVTPAMMHAIDMVVAEKMKMKRHHR